MAENETSAMSVFLGSMFGLKLDIEMSGLGWRE
jgi:hypothetical protein